jgi:histidinol-phosphate aminotransferase
MRSLVRSSIAKLHPYIPGEQPKIKGLIKLNTNENPYSPAPPVLRAIKKAVDDRLRLYPNPTAQPLREALAKLHRCDVSNIIVGNGSDELLAMATRAFVEPCVAGAGDYPANRVQYFSPSYSLYSVLAEIHGGKPASVSLGDQFDLPAVSELASGRKWDFRAALTFITTPNAPSGRGYKTSELEMLCAAQKGVVILDEAYVDFARENAAVLALRHPHVIVSRTFSKAYSLCFQRIGYFLGHPELISALDKIRDSYNVNGLGQIAALETLRNLDYYKRNFKIIIEQREALGKKLKALGFRIFPSQTNFLLVKPPCPEARKWLELLREKKILVRWFNQPELHDYLRITIGADEEMSALVQATSEIIAAFK